VIVIRPLGLCEPVTPGVLVGLHGLSESALAGLRRRKRRDIDRRRRLVGLQGLLSVGVCPDDRAGVVQVDRGPSRPGCRACPASAP